MARRETPQEARERMWGRAPQAGPEPSPRKAPTPGTDTSEGSPTADAAAGPEREEPPPPQHAGPSGSPEPREAPVGELVKQLSEQTSTLVRQEMRLAQVELQEKGKKAGLGVGMFGAGGLVAFFGASALIAAAVLLIATALAAWLSAVIVGVALLGLAGVAALMGKKQIEQAVPPAPEQAIGSVKRDVDTVKRKARK